MRIRLEDLKDNPFRDLRVDPIIEEQVAKIKATVDKHGLLPGVWARRVGDEFQIAAGHHRVRGAIRAGVKEADIALGKYDDAQMVTLYAMENASQRGGETGARIGSVAAAVRFLAKVLLASEDPSKNLEGSGYFKPHKLAIRNAREALLTEEGLGEFSILYFLRNHGGVPITQNVVQQELATLKASGAYARIIEEVRDELELEAEAAAAEAEEMEADRLASKSLKDESKKKAETKKDAADKATDAAIASAKRKKSFDLEGVREHLNTEDHIRTFFNFCMTKAVQEILPVDKQAGLAAYLVKQAPKKVTSTYIHKYAFAMAVEFVHEKRKDKLDEARQENAEQEMQRLVTGFGMGVRSLDNTLKQIEALQKSGVTVTKLVSADEHRRMVKWMTMLEGMLDRSRSLGFEFGSNVLDLPTLRRTKERKQIEAQ